MYHIMTDGLVYSRHETRTEAEAKFEEAKAEAQEEINRIQDDLDYAEEFLLSLHLHHAPDPQVA
jgi:tellurite resistance protein